MLCIQHGSLRIIKALVKALLLTGAVINSAVCSELDNRYLSRIYIDMDSLEDLKDLFCLFLPCQDTEIITAHPAEAFRRFKHIRYGSCEFKHDLIGHFSAEQRIKTRKIYEIEKDDGVFGHAFKLHDHPHHSGEVKGIKITKLHLMEYSIIDIFLHPDTALDS